MNRGLSEKLKAEFPDIIPVLRPQVENQMIPAPNWLSGFVAAEGCFLVIISSSDKSNLGGSVWLRFSPKGSTCKRCRIIKKFYTYGRYSHSQGQSWSNLE